MEQQRSITASSYIDDAIEAWLASIESISNSRVSRRNYQYLIADFRVWLAKKNLDLDLAAWICPDNQEAWSAPHNKAAWRAANAQFRAELTAYASHLKAKQGHASPGTASGRIAMVSSFYSFACDAFFSDYANPCVKVRRPHVDPNGKVAAIESFKIAAAMGRIDRNTLEGARDFALLCFFLMTGRRIAEVARLTWGHIELIGSLEDLAHLDDIRLAVNFARVKGGESARHELDNATALALLESMARIYELNPLYLDVSRPLWPNLSNWVRSKDTLRSLSVDAIRGIVYRRMGTSHVHKLRHSFAQECLRAGLTLPDIAKLLGHKNLATLAVYLTALSTASGENRALPHLAQVFNIH